MLRYSGCNEVKGCCKLQRMSNYIYILLGTYFAFFSLQIFVVCHILIGIIGGRENLPFFIVSSSLTYFFLRRPYCTVAQGGTQNPPHISQGTRQTPSTRLTEWLLCRTHCEISRLIALIQTSDICLFSLPKPNLTQGDTKSRVC